MFKTIWSISWKNIWRNKIRSLVVIISVTLGLFGGMMAVGIMSGWIKQRIDSAIFNEISHIQIHDPEYMNNEDIQHLVKDYTTITKTLDTLTGVKAYSGRSKSFVMVQSDWAVTGLIVRGIEKESEESISLIKNQLIEGEYFIKDHKIPSIVIGSKAAEDLKLLNYQISQQKLEQLNPKFYPVELIAKINKIGQERFRKEKDFKKALNKELSSKEMKLYGDALLKHFSFYRLGAKLTITFTDTAGNILPTVFRVMGIYKTSNAIFDGTNAFVEAKSWRAETGFKDGQVHEIAIICQDNEKAFEVSKILKNKFPDLSILTWREISPDLGYVNDMMKVIDLIYVGIILFALAFGIINTMLMAVLERSKELGMLMAIGMTKSRLFTMIMLESLLLTITGAITGMALCAFILSILSKTGIDFSMWAEGFEALGFSAVVYPIVSARNYIDITLLVIITGIIASLWPARKALEMNPADALRTE
jgi:ABC-type lipoprotein release transport system permease subunit